MATASGTTRLDPAPQRAEFAASGPRSEGARLVPMGDAELALALSAAGTPAAEALIGRLGLEEQAADPGARRAAASSLAARGLLELSPAGRVLPRGAALAAAHLGGGARRAVGLSRMLGDAEEGSALLAIAEGGALILEPGPLGSFLVAAADGAGTAATALERLVRQHLEADGAAIAAVDSRALGEADPARPDLEVAIRRGADGQIEVARAIAGHAAPHRVATMPLDRLGGLIRALAAVPQAADSGTGASRAAPGGTASAAASAAQTASRG